MAETVGDFFVEPLHQWGVRRIYGYPGDGINGVFGALQRAEGAAFLTPSNFPTDIRILTWRRFEFEARSIL